MINILNYQDRSQPKEGEIWHHFLNQYVQIIGVGQDENYNSYVMYRKILRIYNNKKEFEVSKTTPQVMLLKDFMDEVNKEDYPHARQHYVFERTDIGIDDSELDSEMQKFRPYKDVYEFIKDMFLYAYKEFDSVSYRLHLFDVSNQQAYTMQIVGEFEEGLILPMYGAMTFDDLYHRFKAINLNYSQGYRPFGKEKELKE